MTYYKWLLPNRETPIQKTKWPVRVKQWTEDEIPVICKSGWHGIETKDVMTHYPQVSGSELWEVEARGNIVHGGDKFAATSMRLVRMVAKPSDKDLRLFACDVAQDVLWIFEKVHPGDLRVRECIEVARRFALGEASEEEREAAGAAAWAAARDAGAAARAARAAAWAAAWAAARDACAAAEAAARAAWVAAGDAAREKYNTMFCETLGLSTEGGEK